MSEEEEKQELYQKQMEELRKKQLLRSILDSNAYERLQNIKAANEDYYEKISQLLIYLYESKQVTGKITEEFLLKILNKIQENRKEGSITFRRK